MEKVVHIPGTQLLAEYDEFGDVLYVNDGAPRVGITKDDGGLILRYDIDTKRLVGFTLEDFVLYWAPRINDLISKIGPELNLDVSQSQNMRVRMREIVESAKLLS